MKMEKWRWRVVPKIQALRGDAEWPAPKALRAVVKGPAPKLRGEGIKIGRPRHSLEKTTEVASCPAGQFGLGQAKLPMFHLCSKECAIRWRTRLGHLL